MNKTSIFRKSLLLSFFFAPLIVLLTIACSSDNGDVPLPTAQDSGKPDVYKDVGTAKEAAVVDAAKECGEPTRPFLFGDGGVYCPFSALDGGKNVFCSSGTQQCCVTPESAGSPATCQDRDTECPVANSTLLECQHPEDCDQGTCCAGAQVGTDVCNLYLKKFTGTKCRDACQAGELAVCGQTDDCSDGQTCEGVKAKGSTLGVCQ